jgi:Cu(I)/Ag(I) efflux system membrane fusion protein
MSTKRKYVNWLILFVPILLFGCTSGSEYQDHSAHSKQDKKEVVYTCPMDPQIQQSEPGSCPICKMDLELKVDDLTHQIQAPNKLVLSRQSVVKLKSGKDIEQLAIKGQIEVDRTRSKAVSARFGGRIEKIYVKYDYQRIAKGDKILEIYSPELNTVQEEHLFLFEQGMNDEMLKQSRSKLKFLGLTDHQINKLERDKKVVSTITIYSPHSGFVIFSDNETSPTVTSGNNPSMGSMGMSSASKKESNYSSSSEQLREGSYVNKGETYFSINDLTTVWAILSVPTVHSSQFKVQQPLTISSELNSDRSFEGRIQTIERVFETRDQRFIRIRIPLKNDKNQLKINSLVSAKMPLNASQQFTVPKSAVIRTGLNSYVWVRKGKTKLGSGIFELRSVIIAGTSGKYVVISSGLQPNDEIALEAGLLTDSETFLSHE